MALEEDKRSQKMDEVSRAALSLANFFDGEVIVYSEEEIPPWFLACSEPEDSLPVELQNTDNSIEVDAATQLTLTEASLLSGSEALPKKHLTTLTQLRSWWKAAKALGHSEAYLNRIYEIAQTYIGCTPESIEQPDFCNLSFELTNSQWEYLSRDLLAYEGAHQLLQTVSTILCQKGLKTNSGMLYSGKIYTLSSQKSRILVEAKGRGLILCADNGKVSQCQLDSGDYSRFKQFASRLANSNPLLVSG